MSRGMNMICGQYLQDIRTKCADDPPRSSIYFPENAAGPDLVSALEPAETKNRLNECILSVIQLKTGDYKIHDAIRTTDTCTSHLRENGHKEPRRTRAPSPKPDPA